MQRRTAAGDGAAGGGGGCDAGSGAATGIAAAVLTRGDAQLGALDRRGVVRADVGGDNEQRTGMEAPLATKVLPLSVPLTVAATYDNQIALANVDATVCRSTCAK